MSITHAPADDQPKGHRGPRRLAIGGFLLFATGASASAACSVQAMKSDGLIAAVAGNTLGWLLGASSSGDDSGSVFLMVAFVLGFVAGALGLAMMVIATLWSFARLRLRHHAAKGWDLAEPTVVEIGRRGRRGLNAAAERGAPLLRDGSRLVSERLPGRDEAPVALPAAPPSAPERMSPTTRGAMTAGDPLDLSAEPETAS